MTPQAPQSMHSAGSMKKAFFDSPLIACVGQRFSQAVQPVQFSATIVKGIVQWVAESRCRDKHEPAAPWAAPMPRSCAVLREFGTSDHAPVAPVVATADEA